MERKLNKPKMEFDETDHYAQITGIELTREQLFPVDPISLAEKEIEKKPKEPNKMEQKLTWD